MAFKLSTLHIFGYGEVQVIGKDGDTHVNKKAPSIEMASKDAVVNNIYNFKPQNNLSPNEYHAVNIFENSLAVYQPKQSFKEWRVQWTDLDKAAIDALVAEVLAYTPPPPPPAEESQSY